jgi:hypothetical protein
MTHSPHTRVTSSTNHKPKFVKHLPFETASSLTDAKYLAHDMAETYRYGYRAKALLSGHPDVKVGQLIYLDHLEHGMSGYWTVLEVQHLFGSGNAAYQLQVMLGCDVLGDSDPNAESKAEVRDFDAQFAGTSLIAANSLLSDYSSNVMTSKAEGPTLLAPTSKNTPASYKADAPTEYTSDIYQDETPDFSNIKRTVTWRAIN